MDTLGIYIERVGFDGVFENGIMFPIPRLDVLLSSNARAFLVEHEHNDRVFRLQRISDESVMIAYNQSDGTNRGGNALLLLSPMNMPVCRISSFR